MKGIIAAVILTLGLLSPAFADNQQGCDGNCNEGNLGLRSDWAMAPIGSPGAAVLTQTDLLQ
jgi:hypothetical protein